MRMQLMGSVDGGYIKARLIDGSKYEPNQRIQLSIGTEVCMFLTPAEADALIDALRPVLAGFSHSERTA